MHSYSVQFRIFGKDLDPSGITRDLGLEPNHVRIAGERCFGAGKKVWPESLWSYEGDNDSIPRAKKWASLEDGLTYLLDRLASKKSLIRAYAGKFEMIWWCGHFQSSADGGPTLSADLLLRLADLGVPLYIDNYHFTDDDASVTSQPPSQDEAEQ